MIEALPFVAIDLALFGLAVWRPWAGLVALLALLPLNGLVTQVMPVALHLGSLARVAVGGWHDALLLGVVAAAAVAFVRPGPRRLTLVEWLVAGMLVLGAVYVVVSPFLLTALYAYRVLYEPPLLLAAITVLARRSGLPARVPVRAALGFVATTVAGAVFTWPQVYLLRYHFLQVYFTDPGAQIHHSYLAKGINQPRGIGFLNSPNELGAVLAIATLLLLVPGLLPLRIRWRIWALAALSLALVLSFSRSGILATGVGVVVLAWLARDRLPSRASIRAAVRDRAAVLSTAPAAIGWVVLLTLIVTTSGAPTLVKDTITGADPSANGRGASVEAGLTVLEEHPLGLGLGTAGPKAARFGQTANQPAILTETWYVLYAIEVGVFGLALLAITALVILWRLWRARDGPVSRLVIALGIGLGAGALFIPIIEEPTVYTPLWAFAGLALAAAAAVSAQGRGQLGVADIGSAPTA